MISNGMVGPAPKAINNAVFHTFHTLFGTSPNVCEKLWQRCVFHASTQPKHLLWGLTALLDEEIYLLVNRSVI